MGWIDTRVRILLIPRPIALLFINQELKGPKLMSWCFYLMTLKYNDNCFILSHNFFVGSYCYKLFRELIGKNISKKALTILRYQYRTILLCKLLSLVYNYFKHSKIENEQENEYQTNIAYPRPKKRCGKLFCNFQLSCLHDSELRFLMNIL